MLQINHSMTEEKRGSTVETPDPQVTQKTIRRAFTTAFKLSVLEQADQCQGHGEVGALRPPAFASDFRSDTYDERTPPGSYIRRCPRQDAPVTNRRRTPLADNGRWPRLRGA